jgi:2'-5' RNA ligase
VFWVGIEADERLGQLAAAIDEGVATLGVAREKQPYKPHLTLARAGAESSGNPNQRTRSGGTKFASVQKRLQAISAPAFGTMLAREFFLYESKLSPAGARYTKIERFPLEA